MKSPKAAKLIRVYLNENDHSGSIPLYVALTNVLNQTGIAGVIVLRGKMGFGATGTIHGEHFWPLPGEFPVTLECLDSADRINAVLPTILSMLTGGTCVIIDGQIWA